LTTWGCDADASAIDAVQKDVIKARKRGKNLDKLKSLLRLLIHQTPLHETYQDHPLRENRKGYRDAHVEPDWLLLYRVDGEEFQLVRTGTGDGERLYFKE
jgi:mRNA interferase YafQ